MTLTLGCALACAAPAPRRARRPRTGRRTSAPTTVAPPRRARRAARTRPRSTSRSPARATASTEAAGSPASNAIDGDATTQWCSTQWTGNVTVDLGSVRVAQRLRPHAGLGRDDGARQHQRGHRPQRAHAGARPPAADAGGQHARVLAAARHAAGALREDRRDRQRRHAALHRGVPRVLADAVERHPRARRRPLLRAPGGGRGRAVHRRRGPRARRCRSSTVTA